MRLGWVPSLVLFISQAGTAFSVDGDGIAVISPRIRGRVAEHSTVVQGQLQRRFEVDKDPKATSSGPFEPPLNARAIVRTTPDNSAEKTLNTPTDFHSTSLQPQTVSYNHPELPVAKELQQNARLPVVRIGPRTLNPTTTSNSSGGRMNQRRMSRSTFINDFAITPDFDTFDDFSPVFMVFPRKRYIVALASGTRVDYVRLMIWKGDADEGLWTTRKVWQVDARDTYVYWVNRERSFSPASALLYFSFVEAGPPGTAGIFEEDPAPANSLPWRPWSLTP